MEFFIRKNSTLPLLEINLIKDGRTDFRYDKTSLTASTIYFNMKNISDNVYKIAKGVCTYSIDTDTVYYQFTKKNTNLVGRFETEFDIYTSQGLIKFPLRDKLFVNVLDSISNSDFCCGPNKNIAPIQTPIPTSPPPTPTPTPTPSPTIGPSKSGIYYGKVTSPTFTLSNLPSVTFVETNTAVNTYVEFAAVPGYGYTLIPVGFTQPSKFVNSTNGCDGLNVPTNNIGTIVINDINGFPVTYNIYRTYYSIVGSFYSWMCS
jgi:hypothetical protein